MAVIVDFLLHRGNALLLLGDIKNLDDPVDLNGARLRWLVTKQSNVKSPEGILLEKTSYIDDSDDPGGIVITNPTLGLYEIEITENDTIGIAPGPYYHELELFDVDGNYWTPTKGCLTLLDSSAARIRLAA